MNTIVLEGVTVILNGRRILDDISLSVGPGVHILLGANGSGKTTLLKTIAGLVKPTRGKVVVNGIVPWKYDRRRLATVVGYVWQNPYYGFIESRVIDEVRFILDVTGTKGDWYIVEKLVPKKLWDRDPFTLSGGEARRVSIASVLVADQPIWLLDEPFSNLDSKGVKDLIDIINYGRGKGKTIIIATHHILYADLVSPDTIILINNGKLVSHMRPRELNDKIALENGIMPRGILCEGAID